MNASEILTSKEKFHIELGLDRIKKILELLDNPQDKYKIIHIAGTNGKGSTSKLINDFLIEHFKNNKKIGLFTSPHLFDYEERIKINNEDISKSVFNTLIKNTDELAKKNDIYLTEFELLTAAAFYYFYIKNAEYVVLEVGLGGLYDATNICNSIINVITDIDFDHTERLGKTIDEIAFQKAGIIKHGAKVIVSNDNKGLKVIKKAASEKKAKLNIVENIEIKETHALIDNKEYPFNLLGRHQGKNLALALGAMSGFKMSQKTIKNVLKNVTWRYRAEFHKDKNLLIDCAHNPSGAKTLAGVLEDYFKKDKKILIFGCLKNKDYNKELDILSKYFEKIYFYEFDYPNALKFKDLDKKYGAVKINKDKISDIIENNKNLKVVAGSIYMLSKIFS